MSFIVAACRNVGVLAQQLPLGISQQTQSLPTRSIF